MRKLSVIVVPLLLLAAGTATGLLIAEGLLRLVVPKEILPVMFEPDPYTSYRLVRNARERTIREGLFDYTWTTNADGLRARSQLVIPKLAGASRVIVVGDSFTFGVAANDDETYPALLEGRLREVCRDRSIEVINAGVGGFGTTHELILLERRLLAADPDLVIVGFLPNDLENNRSAGLHALRDGRLVEEPRAPDQFGSFRTSDIPGYVWLSRHSVLLNWLRYRVASMTQGGGQRAAAGVTVGRSAMAEFDEADVALTDALLRRMRDTVRAAGSELLIGLIPQLSDAQEYHAGDTAGSVLPRMGAICESAALECVNVAAWMVRTHRKTDPKRLYIPKEYHPTRAGYRLIAEALVEPASRMLGCGTSRQGKVE